MSEAKSTKWVRLGDYIEQRREKNLGYNVPIRGVTRDGFISPKQEDADTSLYNVFYKNDFVFNPARMELNSIYLNTQLDKAICSSLYEIFYIKDTDRLLPEYLNLFIKRDEFARYCWYDAIGSARNYFRVANMRDIEIPLPDIEVQRELVAVYNGLKALADENEALVPKLSAACHAYIVDCREKYPSVQLGKYIEQNNERNLSGLKKVLGMSTTKDFRIPQSRVDYSKLDSYKLVHHNQFVFVPTTDTWKCLAIALSDANMPFVVSPIYVVFGLNGCELLPKFLNLFFKRKEFDRYARYHSWGSARENFSFDEMCRVQIPLPPIEVQQAIVDVFNCAERAKKIAAEARQKLKSICSALVQKAAHS